MNGPETNAKDHVDTNEEKFLRKEAKDTDLSAHPDLVDLIAYKYAGKTVEDSKEDIDNKDLYKDEISEENVSKILTPFQRIANDSTFGVEFVETAVKSDAPFEDIVAIENLIDLMSKGEIVLIQKEIDALKKTIATPQATDNEYKDIADFTSKQQAETRRFEEDLLNNNEAITSKFEKKPHELEGFRNKEKKLESDVAEAFAHIPGVDIDSIHNTTNELFMVWIDRHDKAQSNSEGYVKDMLNKTSVALKEIQNTKTDDGQEQTPHTLSELPLFMMPGELRSFYTKNEKKEQPEFTKALREEMDLSASKVKDSKDLGPEDEDKVTRSLEHLMEEKMPELTKKDQEVLENYVNRLHKNEAEGEKKNLTKGIEGIIKQITAIITAIRAGFDKVRSEMDPDTKAALASLKIINVEEIDAAFLIRNGELKKPLDTDVNEKVKKELFNPNNTEDCFSNLFNEGSAVSTLPETFAQQYITLNKGKAPTTQEHILNNMIAVMHKDDISDHKEKLKDSNGEWNKNLLDSKYKEYKTHMINTVRSGQSVRRDEMETKQQQEMLSRSLVKSNAAALLYYKTDVLPPLEQKDLKKTQAEQQKATTTSPETIPASVNPEDEKKTDEKA